MKGWVYVLSNESMPGLVKVGYTAKDPESRAQELSGDTGVPSPFVLEYEVLLDNPRRVEYKIHQILKSKRHNRNREFFECTTEEAVIAIKGTYGGGAKFEQYHKLERKKIEETIRQKEEERRAEQQRKEAEAKLLEEERQREAERFEAHKLRAEIQEHVAKLAEFTERQKTAERDLSEFKSSSKWMLLWQVLFILLGIVSYLVTNNVTDLWLAPAIVFVCMIIIWVFAYLLNRIPLFYINFRIGRLTARKK